MPLGPHALRPSCSPVLLPSGPPVSGVGPDGPVPRGEARERVEDHIGARADEVGAWRYSEQVLIPRRLQIHRVARALLVHPRHLPYAVVAALADDA